MNTLPSSSSPISRKSRLHNQRPWALGLGLWALDFRLSILALGLSTLFRLHAETIILKSGEKITAPITHSSATEIEVQVPVSANISDTRVISRADIDHIEKPDPSLPEFNTLRALALQPNSRSSQEYDTLISTRLIPFLVHYPQSTKLDQMQKIIATLTDEKQRVIRGETKIENEWFDSFELKAEQKQIAATLAFQQVEATASQDLIGGLNQFALFEKKYPGAKTYPRAVELARQQIAQLRQIVVANLKIIPQREIQRQTALALVSEPQKTQLATAALAESKSVAEAIAAAIKAGDRWVPLYPGNKDSLTALFATVDLEDKRLAALPLATMRQSIDAATQGRKYLVGGDFQHLDQAEDAFARCATLWPANLMIDRNKELLETAKKAAAATPTPSPSPSPGAKPPRKH